MQLFSATFVKNECNFFQNFIARNTYPSYESQFIQSANRTPSTQKNRQFSARIAVLIASGFPRKNRHPFCIKTRLFANVNYYSAQIMPRHFFSLLRFELFSISTTKQVFLRKNDISLRDHVFSSRPFRRHLFRCRTFSAQSFRRQFGAL